MSSWDKSRAAERYARFGTVAVDKGFITVEQLFRAMRLQVEEDLAGKRHRMIGSILFDMKAMTVDQINEVLEALMTAKQTA